MFFVPHQFQFYVKAFSLSFLSGNTHVCRNRQPVRCLCASVPLHGVLHGGAVAFPRGTGRFWTPRPLHFLVLFESLNIKLQKNRVASTSVLLLLFNKTQPVLYSSQLHSVVGINMLCTKAYLYFALYSLVASKRAIVATSVGGKLGTGSFPSLGCIDKLILHLIVFQSFSF